MRAVRNRVASPTKQCDVYNAHTIQRFSSLATTISKKKDITQVAEVTQRLAHSNKNRDAHCKYLEPYLGTEEKQKFIFFKYEW